jgi:hypothetical protein
MRPPDAKPYQEEEATRTKPSRLAEICQIIEDYANDLREILKKLRKSPN